MLSRTGEYALRATIYLAQHEEDWPIPGRHVAAEARIPAKYLLKILGDLARSGVLTSSPGKRGGFRLRRSAKKTSLFDVLSPFERFRERRCPFGHKRCNDRTPCPAHHQWKKVVDTEERFFREMSLHDVSVPKAARGRVAGRRS